MTRDEIIADAVEALEAALGIEAGAKTIGRMQELRAAARRRNGNLMSAIDVGRLAFETLHARDELAEPTNV